MNIEFLTQKSCSSYTEVSNRFREDMKAGRLEKRHTAKRHGYVRKLEYIANVYVGRYGIGYTISSHCEDDPRYYMVTYYTYREDMYGYEVAMNEKYRLYLESKENGTSSECVKHMRACVKYGKMYKAELEQVVSKTEDKRERESLMADLMFASQKLREYMDILREEMVSNEKYKAKQ